VSCCFEFLIVNTLGSNAVAVLQRPTRKLAHKARATCSQTIQAASMRFRAQLGRVTVMCAHC
jgi:hypothetical protein